jgi:hypothetical protein
VILTLVTLLWAVVPITLFLLPEGLLTAPMWKPVFFTTMLAFVPIWIGWGRRAKRRAGPPRSDPASAIAGSGIHGRSLDGSNSSS